MSDPVRLELQVGAVAHGGHCVARHGGRVVFVRHTLPGERVIAKVTEGGEQSAFWRADAVTVLDASPDRVDPAWPAAGPAGVGGGELSHVRLSAQLRWKSAVIEEQLHRLARIDRPVTVRPMPGDDVRGGLGWRTRISLVTDEGGRAGMFAHRTHKVIALRDMPLAVPAIAKQDLFTRRWPTRTRIEVAAPGGEEADDGRVVVLVDGVPWRGQRPDRRPNAAVTVRHDMTLRLGGQERRYGYRVAASGFWQVHREAAQVLAQTVLDAARPALPQGGRVVDLYCGAGLFAAPLADLVGPAGQVLAVESDRVAVRDARRALHERPWVDLRAAKVASALEQLGSPDVVVADPPRAGAGRRVVSRLAAAAPRRIVLVACDPAAMARDVALFAENGYRMVDLVALDMFPHTHHVECVVTLEPDPDKVS